LNINTKDKIIVRDKNTNKVILSGVVKNITNNPFGYSIDNILFINPNSEKFIIEKIDSADNFMEDLETIKQHYILFTHNDIDNTFEYDFFMWNDIEPEVKQTVNLLNSLGCVETYSSCSGHGKIPSYIDFHIINFESFLDLICFLNKNGIKSYCNKHKEAEEDTYKLRFLIGVEGRGTCHLELVDVGQTFDELNKVLRKYKYKVS